MFLDEKDCEIIIEFQSKCSIVPDRTVTFASYNKTFNIPLLISSDPNI
jgi:hypothetical protein